MPVKTVRSRSSFEIGQKVEGCVILEKKTVIPPDLVERRLGVYDYLVEAPVIVAAVKPKPKSKAAKTAVASGLSSFTRSTPDEMGSVIRRLPSR